VALEGLVSPSRRTGCLAVRSDILVVLRHYYFLVFQTLSSPLLRAVSRPGGADGGLRLRESGLAVPGPAAPPGPTAARDPAGALRSGRGSLLADGGLV